METEFEKRLAALINEYSKENDSDTPNFILERYLNEVLKNFNAAVMDREQWYGRIQHVEDDSHYKIPFDFDGTSNPDIIPTTTGVVIATPTLQYNDGVNFIPVEIDEQEMIRKLEEKGYVINKEK